MLGRQASGNLHVVQNMVIMSIMQALTPALTPARTYWQLAVLNNSAAEDLGDQEALEAELERELAAAEAADEGAAVPTPQGKKVCGNHCYVATLELFTEC